MLCQYQTTNQLRNPVDMCSMNSGIFINLHKKCKVIFNPKHTFWVYTTGSRLESQSNNLTFLIGYPCEKHLGKEVQQVDFLQLQGGQRFRSSCSEHL